MTRRWLQSADVEIDEESGALLVKIGGADLKIDLGDIDLGAVVPGITGTPDGKTLKDVVAALAAVASIPADPAKESGRLADIAGYVAPLTLKGLAVVTVDSTTGGKTLAALLGVALNTGLKRLELAPETAGSSHVGTLRNLIYFGFDTTSRSVVVGPTPLGAVGTVPPTLEYGGPGPVRRNPRRRHRKVGDGGEIRIGGPLSGTTKRTPEGKWVTYTRLTTGAQAERANRLNEELYGPEYIGGKRIEARPYMGPALRAEMPALPTLWSNSVR